MGKLQKTWNGWHILPSLNMSAFTSSTFQLSCQICIYMTWPWKFGGNYFLSIAFPSPVQYKGAYLSVKLCKQNQLCKSVSGQIFPTSTFIRKDQWHIRLYRDEGSKYILVFNKQQENYKRINMSNRMPVNLLLTQAISGDSCAAFAIFSFRNWSMKTQGLKCNPRTEMWRLQSSHSVGAAFAWASTMTRAPPSLGWIISLPPRSKSSGGSLHQHVRLQLSNWELVAHLHIRCLCLSQAFVQVIILRLDFEIYKTNVPEISVLDIFKTLWALQKDIIVLMLLVQIFLQTM